MKLRFLGRGWGLGPLAIALAALLLTSCAKPAAPKPPSDPAPTAAVSSETEPAVESYPAGKMFVSADRLEYCNNDLVLRIPKLKLETGVLGEYPEETRTALLENTMSPEEKADFFGNSGGTLLLKSGVVLLNSATLPDPLIPNPNVSISGHRDLDGCEFYYIDQLGKGDRIYLDYKGTEYVYEWFSTTIHEADDWSITYCGDESIVSLISCHPLGTNRMRIVARGRLVETNPLPAAPQNPDASNP